MTTRSRADLERALRGLGVRCTVEEWDALAVAVPEPEEHALENDEIRARAVALARAHGFSHLAVELSGSARVAPTEPGAGAPSRATLPRD